MFNFKYKCYLQAARHILLEFCETTTIHGIRYWTETGTHWSEKIYWIIVVILSMGFCGWSTQNIFLKWHESPVVVVLAEKESRISDIPFPTVTICTETKFLASKLSIGNIISKENISDEE